MSSRILTFDLLRGYFLLSLLLNHLQRYPSGFDILTMRGMLFISPAEGFFIVSGIILGIVRGHKLKEASFKVAAWLLVRRGLSLYAWAVGLTILFTVIGWAFIDAPRLKPGIASMDGGILSVLIGSLSLQYVYGWADFLRLYAVFILAAPVALWLLRKHAWWAVAGGSLVVWALFPENVFLRWQLLFFGGLVLGYHRYEIAAYWQQLKIPIRRWCTIGVVGVAVIAILINIGLVFGPKILPGTGLAALLSSWHVATSPFFDKETLAFGRLVMTAVVFAAGFLLFRRFEHIILKRAGFLLTLGRHSLFVYIAHSFLIFGLDLFVPERQFALNVVVSILAIGAIFGLIHVKQQVPMYVRIAKNAMKPRRKSAFEEEPEAV